jgi:hypothetical protein
LPAPHPEAKILSIEPRDHQGARGSNATFVMSDKSIREAIEFARLVVDLYGVPVYQAETGPTQSRCSLNYEQRPLDQ